MASDNDEFIARRRLLNEEMDENGECVFIASVICFDRLYMQISIEAIYFVINEHCQHHTLPKNTSVISSQSVTDSEWD